MRVNAYRNPPELSGTGIVNTRAWRAAEVPSTNGHGNARAVARLYSALAGDGDAGRRAHPLAGDRSRRAIEEQVYGDDLVLQRPTRFGLGFQLTMTERRLGPNPRAFGHFGAGGSLGFADPDARRRVRLRDEPGPRRAGSTSTCATSSISSTRRSDRQSANAGPAGRGRAGARRRKPGFAEARLAYTTSSSTNRSAYGARNRRGSQAMLTHLPMGAPRCTSGTTRTPARGIRALDGTTAMPYPARASATRVEGAPLSSNTRNTPVLTRNTNSQILLGSVAEVARSQGQRKPGPRSRLVPESPDCPGSTPEPRLVTVADATRTTPGPHHLNDAPAKT